MNTVPSFVRLRVFCSKTAFALLLALAGPVHAATPEDLAARYGESAYLAKHKHKEVRVLTVGDGPQRAYVFIPAAPRPKKAPLVLFHHGWLGTSPKNFGALIDHLVKRGAVVIYPVYQDPPHTSPQDVTALAGNADRDALEAVEDAYPHLVERDKTLYFGYSMGAAISFNLALNPGKYDLPPPRALVLAAPGDAHHVAKGPDSASIIGKIEKLPADLPVALMTGASDTSIGLPTARALAPRLCRIKADRRTLLIFPSDEHGDGHIKSGHGSPGAPDTRYDFADPRGPVPKSISAREGFEASTSLNTLDFYGYWKVVDGVFDWVTAGRYPREVFGHGAETRFLGLWPDGTPYKPALIEDPCAERD